MGPWRIWSDGRPVAGTASAGGRPANPSGQGGFVAAGAFGVNESASADSARLGAEAEGATSAGRP